MEAPTREWQAIATRLARLEKENWRLRKEVTIAQHEARIAEVV